MTLDFAPNRAGVEVLTHDGFRTFAGVAHMGFHPVLKLTFGSKRGLTCTANHELYRPDGAKIRADDLVVGEWVALVGGRRTRLKSVEDLGEIRQVYDLIEVEGGHRFVANSLVVSNCAFVSDDQTLINPLSLARLIHNQPIFYTGTVRWFRDIEPNKTYLVGMDPSMGMGRDYSTIQIFQAPEMIQVGEWQHNGTPPKGQVNVLLQTLRFIDDALRSDDEQNGEPEIFWSFENNAVGDSVLQVIEATGIDRFPGHCVSEIPRPGSTRRVRIGLTTTNTNKMTACTRLKSLIESDRLLVNSQNLLRELKNYVATANSFKAKLGETDDLVSATLIVIRILDLTIDWMMTTGDLKDEILDEEGYEEPLPIL